MPDREKSDHWDLLASDLGAEIPEEGGREDGASAPRDVESGEITPPEDGVPCDAEPTVPATEAEISTPTASEPEVRTAPAPTNWGELAAKLGVEVPEEPVEAVVDEPSPDEPSPDEPDTDQRQAFAWDEPAETPPLLVEEAEESAPIPGAEVPDEPALPKAESVAVDRDVEPRPSDAGSTESKSGRRRRKRRRRPRGAGADEPTETPEELAKDAFAEGLFDLADAEPTTVEASVGQTSGEQSSSVEEPAPGRPKRRRRRGSGQKKAAAKKGTESTEAEPAAGERSSVDEAAELTGQPAGAPLDDDVKRSAREEEEGGEPAKGAKMSHRGIPTWAEAIDIIISTNMDSRAKRPGGGSGRSREGRKRGGRSKSSEKTS